MPTLKRRHRWVVVRREPVELVVVRCTCGCGAEAVQIGRPGGPRVGVAVPQPVVRATEAIRQGIAFLRRVDGLLDKLQIGHGRKGGRRS